MSWSSQDTTNRPHTNNIPNLDQRKGLEAQWFHALTVRPYFLILHAAVKMRDAMVNDDDYQATDGVTNAGFLPGRN